MRNKKLKRRFIFILILFTVSVAGLWMIYHNTVTMYIRQTTEEAIALSKNNLLTDLNDEFTRLNAAVTVIGGSIFTQEFLIETEVDSYYEKAAAVAEIIRKTVYPALNGDSIYTISANGSFYRFTGGISSDAFESIYKELIGRTTVYSVVELGETGWFCLSSPVYQHGMIAGQPIGHIIVFSNLSQARRALTKLDTMSGIDTAVIVDDMILFSSNPELDGKSVAELDRQYGSVVIERVAGSNIYAAAAITFDALHYGERLFLTISLIVLIILLITFALLYKLLSSKMVNPMLENTDNLHMGLLKKQIDAHFIVNTITCIEGLAHQGKTEKIAAVSQNLAHILKSRYQPDTEINVFDQLEDVERYIEIMNIRSDDRYKVTMDIGDELFYYNMLTQVLQPIVENALTHGLGNKENDCNLTIFGKLECDYIHFEITDNGIGIQPIPLRALQEMLDNVVDLEYEEHSLKGIALMNIQRRIRTRYGKQYGLVLSSIYAKGLTVTVKLPLLKQA